MEIRTALFALALMGCAEGEAKPASIPPTPSSPAPSNGDAERPAPKPAPTPVAASGEKVRLPDLPSYLRTLRVTRGSWRLTEKAGFRWERGLVARMQLDLPWPVANAHLRMNGIPPRRAGVLPMETEAGPVIDVQWTLAHDAWSQLQIDQRVDLALTLDHSRIAAKVKKYANIQKHLVASTGHEVSIGQGRKLQIAWGDKGEDRVLGFSLDAVDPKLPVVLCLVASGLGSGKRALAERIAGGGPFDAGKAKALRVIYVEFENGWVRAGGTDHWLAADGTDLQLGWIIPKGQTDSTQPIALKLAVLQLPLIVLRDVPVGW